MSDLQVTFQIQCDVWPFIEFCHRTPTCF